MKIAFCDTHRAQYFTFRWGGVAAAIAGLSLIPISIFAKQLPSWLEPLLFIAGCLLIGLAVFLRFKAPTLQLDRQTSDGMWVKGAGEPFLKLYALWPAAPIVHAV